jgi:hypothetical protein
MQAGALQAVECAVIPLLAMVAGVFVDRFPQRPMMIGANLVRGLAPVSLPFAFVLHHATLVQFFVVSFVVGLASVVFDSAYVAFFPALVPREQIAEGNAKMSMGSCAEAVPMVRSTGSRMSASASARSSGRTAASRALAPDPRFATRHAGERGRRDENRERVEADRQRCAQRRHREAAQALLGRMSATNRALVCWFGACCRSGALVAGYLGSALGIVPTMLVGCLIALGAALWMLGCPKVVLDSPSLSPVEVLAAA